MPRTAFILLIFLFSLHVSLAQEHIGVGYTAGSINGDGGVAGGLSLTLGYNFAEWKRSSFSLSTNAKLGFQDKIGSALLLPLAFASGDGSTAAGTTATDGGTVNIFTELPLLLHYNYGFGSSTKLSRYATFGFYFGGGISMIQTGFSDTAGYSRPASFTGWVLDGGIRINREVDINFATVISTQGPIEQIQHPLFFEVTISAIWPR